MILGEFATATSTRDPSQWSEKENLAQSACIFLKTFPTDVSKFSVDIEFQFCTTVGPRP